MLLRACEITSVKLHRALCIDRPLPDPNCSSSVMILQVKKSCTLLCITFPDILENAVSNKLDIQDFSSHK
jgi:hypothetical protein